MRKVRMFFRSKTKNDDHIARMKLAQDVKNYISSDKYKNPEKYFNQRLQKIKSAGDISKTVADEFM